MPPDPPKHERPFYLSTFSIVGFDPREQAWGIAVASKFPAVGAVVPWAAADVGAVATQSYANTTYGPLGLEMMGAGKSAQQALDALVNKDAERDSRQAGLVDAKGEAATFTGEDCLPWAGGTTGEYFAAQGNILTGPETVEAMVATFLGSEGDLPARLLASLLAGDRAGGDRRGRQSAALFVVKPKGGYAGFWQVDPNARDIGKCRCHRARAIEVLQYKPSGGERTHQLLHGGPGPGPVRCSLAHPPSGPSPLEQRQLLLLKST